MSDVNTDLLSRTLMIREAAREAFAAALHELEPAQQHAIINDIIQLDRVDMTGATRTVSKPAQS